MASSSRNKIYVFIIGILLLSNIALVAFFVLNKPEKKIVHRGDRPGGFMKEALQKEVGFNEQQMAQFEQMAGQHREQMRPLFEDIASTKENFYKLLAQPSVPDSTLKAASFTIGEKQRQIDIRIFRHFQNIRQLCTPAQQPGFDSLIQRVVHKMVFPMRRGDNIRDSLKTTK